MSNSLPMDGNAHDALVAAYTEMRAVPQGTFSEPITARSLEQMIKLAVSNARKRSSQQVTLKDAQHAISFYRRTLNKGTAPAASGSTPSQSSNNARPCKFGVNCHRADCYFSHPPERVVAQLQSCVFVGDHFPETHTVQLVRPNGVTCFAKYSVRHKQVLLTAYVKRKNRLIAALEASADGDQLSKVPVVLPDELLQVTCDRRDIRAVKKVSENMQASFMPERVTALFYEKNADGTYRFLVERKDVHLGISIGYLLQHLFVDGQPPKKFLDRGRVPDSSASASAAGDDLASMMGQMSLTGASRNKVIALRNPTFANWQQLLRASMEEYAKLRYLEPQFLMDEEYEWLTPSSDVDDPTWIATWIRHLNNYTLFNERITAWSKASSENERRALRLDSSTVASIQTAVNFDCTKLSPDCAREARNIMQEVFMRTQGTLPRNADAVNAFSYKFGFVKGNAEDKDGANLWAACKREASEEMGQHHPLWKAVSDSPEEGPKYVDLLCRSFPGVYLRCFLVDVSGRTDVDDASQLTFSNGGLEFAWVDERTFFQHHVAAACRADLEQLLRQ